MVDQAKLEEWRPLVRQYVDVQLRWSAVWGQTPEERAACYDENARRQSAAEVPSDLGEALYSIYNAIALGPKDWSPTKNDAWIYGIVCGWDDAAYAELTPRFGWTSDMVERNRRLHRAFAAVRWFGRVADNRGDGDVSDS